jgi:pilus assembly protein CpaB
VKKVKILAILAGALAAILIFVLLSSVIKFGGAGTTEIVTASKTIVANTIITEDMLVVSDIPTDAVLPGAITTVSQAVGKTVKADLYEGEQLISEKLISPGDTSNATLAYALKSGMRAITIAVDATSGVAGMLHPADKIDLLGEFDSNGVSVTDMVEENITILAVDNNRSSNSVIGDGSIVSYSTLTLEVTPAQAMEISSAARNGALRVILRSPLDSAILNYKSISISNVLNLQ